MSGIGVPDDGGEETRIFVESRPVVTKGARGDDLGNAAFDDADGGGWIFELNAKEHFYHVSTEGAIPFAEAEDEGEAVTIPKDKYDLMIEDLLTMAELLGMVADMRTKDVRAIQEFGKYVPAFAAFEKNRLRLYREAAKEAEDILNRWEDEIDEDDEPDEYFSD